VKRRALVRHLTQHGCRLLREGANHSIFVSPLRSHIDDSPPRRNQRRPRQEDLQGSRDSTAVASSQPPDVSPDSFKSLIQRHNVLPLSRERRCPSFSRRLVTPAPLVGCSGLLGLACPCRPTREGERSAQPSDRLAGSSPRSIHDRSQRGPHRSPLSRRRSRLRLRLLHCHAGLPRARGGHS
jgi:hypothetical protein